MTSIASVERRGVLADRLPASAWLNVVLVVAGAALTAVAAQIAIPLWPVPMTGQTFAVLLLGAVLGPRRAVGSLVLYAAAGVLGLPVFTDHAHGWSVIVGPTGGYLLGFPLAALTVGYLARRGWDRSVLRMAAAFILGDAVIYAVGLPLLALALAKLGIPHTLPAVLAAGLVPFLVGDAIKMVIAAALLPVTWRVLPLRSLDDGRRTL